jgi:hypothetical protein
MPPNLDLGLCLARLTLGTQSATWSDEQFKDRSAYQFGLRLEEEGLDTGPEVRKLAADHLLGHMEYELSVVFVGLARQTA